MAMAAGFASSPSAKIVVWAKAMERPRRVTDALAITSLLDIGFKKWLV